MTTLPHICYLRFVKKGRANELYACNGHGTAKVGFMGGQHEDISARSSAGFEKVEKSQNLERLDSDTDRRAFRNDAMDFANKANMNKYLKIMGPIRQQVAAESGMQTWLYHGPVKASG